MSRKLGGKPSITPLNLSMPVQCPVHFSLLIKSMQQGFHPLMLLPLMLCLLVLNACGPQTTDASTTQPAGDEATDAEAQDSAEQNSRRHFLARIFNPDGEEPAARIKPWDEQKFIEDNNINTLEEIDENAIGFHVMLHNLVMNRPSEKLHSFIENLDTPKSITPAMIAAWDRNGYILRAVPNDQIEFFFANLTDILSRDSEPILPTGTAVPIDMLNVRDKATLLFVNDDNTITPIDLTRGSAQMHVKLLPPLSKSEVAPTFSLVPHFHGFSSLNFRTPSARDRTTIGTTFDELRIRSKLPKDEAWVLLAKPHKPLESEDELRERLIKERLFRNRTSVPSLYANGQSLAELTMHALQGVSGKTRKVQRLMIIAPHWPQHLLEKENKETENTTNNNTTQPDPNSNNDNDDTSEQPADTDGDSQIKEAIE